MLALQSSSEYRISLPLSWDRWGMFSIKQRGPGGAFWTSTYDGDYGVGIWEWVRGIKGNMMGVYAMP